MATTLSVSTAAPAPKQMRLFYNTMLSCKYVFSNGIVANFINGKYATQAPDQIAELEREIAAGNQYLYIKAGQETIDYDHTDPMAELRKKFFAEYEELQAKEAAARGNLNTGVAVQGALKATSTTDIAPVTIGATK